MVKFWTSYNFPGMQNIFFKEWFRFLALFVLDFYSKMCFWDIAITGPIFPENLPINANHANKLALVVFYGLVSGDTWKTSPNMFKSHFGWKNHDSESFWALFLYWKIHGKGRFSPYPAELKHKYLENGARYWHSVKSSDSVIKMSFR